MNRLASERVRNVAFVFTEYQQTILLAICLQESLHIDCMFVRAGIPVNSALSRLAQRVERIADIPYSWKNVRRYAETYEESIAPCIQSGAKFRLFVHSLVNPYVKLFACRNECTQIELFEEGAGSYINWGRFFSNSGIRVAVASAMTSAGIHLMSRSLRRARGRNARGWSLFDGCFPRQGVQPVLISHESFRQAVEFSIETTEVPTLETGSSVFVQQPFVEMGIMSEEQYVELHVEALRRIRESGNWKVGTIFWKCHPRTNLDQERDRVGQIESGTGLRLELVGGEESIEKVALRNRDRYLNYFTLASSALYVLKALCPESSVRRIGSPALMKKLRGLGQLEDFYDRLGVPTI